jgi:antitoxin (DNA-binding transcriptional repressor) of toxin-antitoxin stability system
MRGGTDPFADYSSAGGEAQRGRAMPVVVTLEEMEANPRKLLHAVRDGKHVIVTERNVPIALLNPPSPKKEREFGALKGQFAVGKEFFDPLPEEELAAWE